MKTESSAHPTPTPQFNNLFSHYALPAFSASSPSEGQVQLLGSPLSIAKSRSPEMLCGKTKGPPIDALFLPAVLTSQAELQSPLLWLPLGFGQALRIVLLYNFALYLKAKKCNKGKSLHLQFHFLIGKTDIIIWALL